MRIGSRGWPPSEELLGRHGFTDIERIDVPFVVEFADPVAYSRAMAATDPAHEAMQNVGEQQFLDAAVGNAKTRVRAGLPLRTELAPVGYLARKGGPEQRPDQRFDRVIAAFNAGDHRHHRQARPGSGMDPLPRLP